MEHVLLCVEFWQCRSVFRPGAHFGAQKKRELWGTIVYKIYAEILFHKVAVGYVINGAQNVSLKNILEQMCLHINLKNQKITRPGFHLGAQQNVKWWQHIFSMFFEDPFCAKCNI